MSIAHFFDDQAPMGRPQKYSVSHLAIGETAYFANAECRKVGNAVRHKKPMRFACRTVVKGGIPHVKVTRIA